MLDEDGRAAADTGAATPLCRSGECVPVGDGDGEDEDADPATDAEDAEAPDEME